jgi:hypothetical protein
MDRVEEAYAYLGHRSKNSILGNAVRGLLLSKSAKTLASLSKSRLTEDEAKRLARSNGTTFISSPEKRVASYVYGENEGEHFIEVSPDLRNKYIVAHELGHHNASKDKGSFNTKHMRNSLLDSPRKIPDDIIRAEREAWVNASKLVGKPKTLIDRYQMKSALGSYEKGLESDSQVHKFTKDPEYTKKMLSRTGVKLGGAVVGGALGAIATSKLLSITKARFKVLYNKPNKTEAEIKETLKLKRRISRYMKLGMITGTIGGYALSKKYLTKSID